MQGLYGEDYKALWEEIKENQKNGEVPCLWMGRLVTVMSSSPK